MKNTKTIGKLIAFMMIVFSIFTVSSVFAEDIENVPVYVTIKDENGTVLKHNQNYTTIQPGDKIYVTAYCNHERALYWSQNSYFMSKKGFKLNDKGMAILAYKYDDTLTANATHSADPTQMVITIPSFPEGTTHKLRIQGVGAVDDETFEGKYHIATSGWIDILFTVAKKDLTGNISASHNNATLVNNSTTVVEEGSKVTINGTPAENFSTISCTWQIDNGTPSKITLAETSKILDIPGAKGQTVVLTVKGDLKDGNTTATKKYIFKIANEPEEISGNIVVKMNSKTLYNNSVNVVYGNEIVMISGEPSNNFASIIYSWDDGEEKQVTGSIISIPVLMEKGYTHTLKIYGILVDGTKTLPRTYHFISEDTEYEENEGDELIIEPWMREDMDAEGLLVSLRNDTEDDKANKNFYMLDEKVIYYVDYKNCGKAINDEVKIVLQLPLDFKVISSDGGTVSSSKDTITWTYRNGLEAEQSGTKVVTIKYSKLSKKTYDYEMVYPQAKVYRKDKLIDSSAVINCVYLDDSTVIQNEHEPYMFGDKEKPTFRPDDTITRAEGALVLTRIFGIKTTDTSITTKYSDIDDTYVEAQRAISAATKLGIINGYKDGTYRPNDKMTKAEFMKIIASYVEVLGETENIDGLEVKDSNIKVYKNNLYKDHWAIDYVTLLVRLNMTPVSESKKDLGLNNYITRAEVAQLINFYLFRAPAKLSSSIKIGFIDVKKNHDLYEDIVEATRDTHKYVITYDGKERAK